jgi:phosphoribosyl 1,2-cyclic phosphodiesterase
LAEDHDFFVRFWGVRGSIACPGAKTMRYGGNTACLEIGCGDRMLIFDAGTGLHALGSDLSANRGIVGGDLKYDLFFTHTHFDHICGFPFFQPAFDPSNKLRIWAGHLLPERTIREVLIYLMMDPLFPIPIDTMRAKLDFEDFEAGKILYPGDDISIRTAPLNHPNGATGYRIDYGGRSICYVTDTEHVVGEPDQNILGLIEGADYFIYDSTYSDDEFAEHKGWGHSTWQEGARLADQAGVGTFVVFHHDPDHDDAHMDTVTEAVEAVRPGSIVAREDMILTP